MISSAYRFLNDVEKAVVDDFVSATVNYALSNNELIRHSIDRPIPAEMVKRSKGMLEKPLVLAAIHSRLVEIADDQDLDPARVLKEHMNIATANIIDYIRLDEETGNPIIDIQHCTREQMAAVKKLTTTSGLFGVKVDLELHSKQAHLDALGKMMGLDEADNSTYLKHIAKPKDIQPMLKSDDMKQVEQKYIKVLEEVGNV